MDGSSAGIPFIVELHLAPISTIIPVLDRPLLVQEAVSSVMQGSLVPQELIVVLSPLIIAGKPTYPDKAAVQEKLREIAQNYLPIDIKKRFQARFICSARPFAAAARDLGALHAQNPWLAFLDSDDLWQKDKLAKQWNYLRKRPHLNACHCGEEWRRSDRVLKQPPHLRPHRGRFLRSAFRHCLISCSALLIRKSTFQECGGFDESFEVCEDFAFFLRYLKDHSIGLVSERLVIKRSDYWPQLSKKFHSLDALRIRAIVQFLKAFGRELQKEERESAASALKDKLKILKGGAIRRGHRDALHKYELLGKEIEAVLEPLISIADQR